MRAAPGAPRDGRRQFALNAATSWLANGIKAVLQLALLPVMAHLLTPTDFGLYALAQPAVMFFVTLADSGIGASLAREDEANTLAWSTAFWLLIASFSAMALLVAGSGYALAFVTGQARLVGVMGVLALALPLMALAIPSDARIMRRGNLTLHSWMDIASALSSAAVALTLALNGFGVWSLVGQYLTIYLVRAIITNAIAFERPRLEFDFSSLRGHLAMGSSLVTRRLGELVGRSAENALFERVFGAGFLGSYAVANQTSRFACDVLTNPPIGALYAYAIRERQDAVRELHARLVRLVSAVLFPAAILAAATAPRLLPLVLGPKWGNAVPMFQPIVVSYAILAIAGMNDPVLMSNDLTRRATVPALVNACARIGVVAFGPWIGPVGVAWGIAAVFLTHAASLTLTVPSPLTEGARGAARGQLPPLVAGAVAAVVAYFALRLGDGVPVLASALALGGLSYAAVLWIVAGPALRDEASSLVRVIRRRRSEARTA